MNKENINKILNSLEKGSCVVVTVDGYDFVILYEGVDNGNLVWKKAAWNGNFGYTTNRNALCRLEDVQDVRLADDTEEKMLRSYIENWT